MEHEGKLIVFEGPDAVGKSELAARFIQYLEKSGIACEYVAFPGREPGTLGHHVYQLHHHHQDLGLTELNPTSLQLLHIAAHLDAIKSKIAPAIAQGRWVVLDRFWWSTWVYGIVNGAEPQSLRLMIELERKYWNRLTPLIVFLVCRKTPLGKTPRSHWNRLVKEYTTLAAGECKAQTVCCIDNDGPIAASMDQAVGFAGAIQGSVRPCQRPCAPKGRPKKRTRPGTDPHTLSALSWIRLAPAKPTIVFDTYWKFATERQEIFFRRLQGCAPPWTNDEILREYKFTNAYRASDRTSQYLIRNVIYAGDQSPEELFFRTLLFKFFNRIDTWELLSQRLGQVAWRDYSFQRYDAILTKAAMEGKAIYSAAYIMPSGGPSLRMKRKHRMHLKLLERMMNEELPARLADATSMAAAFDLLHSYPTIGDFLAYQFVTDLNYGTLTNFSEMEFVVPGPGARSGIRKCFQDLGGLTEADIIRVVTERQEAEFKDRGLDFQTLGQRRLQLVDCQNLFCEVDKYARIKHPDFSSVTGRRRIKQRYKSINTPLSNWYPPKWGVNECLASGENNVPRV